MPTICMARSRLPRSVRMPIPARAIAIGVSAGGAAVMALAARNPKNLRGVINVSGGLQTPDCPKEDVLVNAFKDYGASSRVPSIWVYAKNDSLFGPALVERMQSAYLDGGGDVKLVMFDKHGDDGHQIFAEAGGRSKWLMEMDAFLSFHDLPATQRDRAADLMKRLKLSERSRGFVDQYLAAPTFKAMVQTPDGQNYMTQFGATTLDIARSAALENCQTRHKASRALHGHHGERYLGRTDRSGAGRCRSGRADHPLGGQ